MRVSLVIPALNEADSLPEVLAEVPQEIVSEVIVVDNGSTDETGEAARASGARVIEEPRRGYGFACAAGAAAADGEVVAFMDGDGSFDPRELPGVVGPLLRGDSDLVLGSRMLRDDAIMPFHQSMGNRFFAWLLRRRFGLRLTDLGPFRALKRHHLLDLGMREQTHGWPLEMIIRAARRGLRIVEVPVTYRPRLAGSSKVGGTLRGSVLAAYRLLSVAVRYAL